MAMLRPNPLYRYYKLYSDEDSYFYIGVTNLSKVFLERHFELCFERKFEDISAYHHFASLSREKIKVDILEEKNILNEAEISASLKYHLRRLFNERCLNHYTPPASKRAKVTKQYCSACDQSYIEFKDHEKTKKHLANMEKMKVDERHG